MAGTSAAQPLDGNYAPLKNTLVTPGVGYVAQQGGLTSVDPITGQTVAPNVLQLLAAANQAASDNVAAANLLMIVFGRQIGTGLFSAERMSNIFKPFNAQAVTISSANTPTSIWTPASGKKFRLLGYWFSTTAAAGLVFHDLAVVGGGGLLPIPSPIAAANGILASPPLGLGFLSAAINNQLWVDATAATTLSGFCFGLEE